LYAKVWFSGFSEFGGENTQISLKYLVQIEQIPRYHPHTPKTLPSFILEAIQTSALHGRNPRYRHMRNLYRFLEFAEIHNKFSGKSPKSAK